MGCTQGSDASSSFHENYKLGKEIGRGGYARVRLARDVRHDANVAVKILDMRSKASSGTASCRMAKREASILRKVGVHHNCVQLIEVFTDQYFCYLVTELCDAPLLSTLGRLKVLSELTLVPFVRGMLRGLQHLHSLHIVHRDIKLENILCSGPQCVTKLCDFGVAASLSDGQEDTLSGIYGTIAYCSPEMVSERDYGTKTDMWSLGILVYALLFGHMAYHAKDGSASATKQVIRAGRPQPSYSLHTACRQAGAEPVSTRAQDFVRALLVREPKWRSSASMALASTYLNEASCGPSTSIKPMLTALRRQKEEFQDKPEADSLDRHLNHMQRVFHHGSSTMGEQRRVSQSSSLATAEKSSSPRGYVSATRRTSSGMSSQGCQPAVEKNSKDNASPRSDNSCSTCDPGEARAISKRRSSERGSMSS